MAFIETTPFALVTLSSFILLSIQKIRKLKSKIKKFHDNDDKEDHIINNYFSTIKRDSIKTLISLIQSILFTFLLVLSALTFFKRSKKLSSTLNKHLTLIYFTSFLSLLWQIRNLSGGDENQGNNCSLDQCNIDIPFVITNTILSLLATTIAITTPRGPPEYDDNGRLVSPNSYSSIWDFITFSTMNPLMCKAYKKDSLSDSDLDQLPRDYRASTLFKKFEKYSSPTTVIGASLYYVPITFLYSFLNFIQTNPSSLGWGFFCIFGMLISNILYYISTTQQWYWSASAMQVSIKGMLNAEIFSKSLRLSYNANNDDEAEKNSKDEQKDSSSDMKGVGKITNLMTVDSQRIGQFSMWWTTALIDCPTQITIGLYFLYRLLGVASIFGFMIMIVIIPINQQTAKYFAKTQEKLMKARDNRVNLMNELLQGIRMIKFFAWEKNWTKQVLETREVELVHLRKNFLFLLAFNFIWLLSPVLVSIVSFAVFSKIQGNVLTPSIVFTSIAIFNEIRFVLNQLPEVLMQGFQAYVIKPKKRIAFENANISWGKPSSSPSTNSKIDFIMKDLNIEFPLEKLSIICGPTGSGKTLLLMALLEETNIISGKVYSPRSSSNNDVFNQNNSPLLPANWIVDNSVAYVAQESWLQNASIRDNILFGLPYIEKRYNEVISMCALTRDFEILEDGDLTEVGEKGLTLSGGQKQRCALARAVYSRAKHILIDDALSAVDAHTAKHLIDDCITGSLMKGRTRILVTHHIGLALSKADYLVVLESGKVVTNGVVDDLRSSGELSSVLKEADSDVDFNDLAEAAAETIPLEINSNNKNLGKIMLHQGEPSTSSSITVVNNGDNSISEEYDDESNNSSDVSSIRSDIDVEGLSSETSTIKEQDINNNGNNSKGGGSGNIIKRLLFNNINNNNNKQSSGSKSSTTAIQIDSKKPRVLIKEEERAKGTVKLNIYLKYFNANGNLLFWIMVIFLFFTTRAAQIIESWWLKVWSSSSSKDPKNVTQQLFNMTTYNINNDNDNNNVLLYDLPSVPDFDLDDSNYYLLPSITNNNYTIIRGDNHDVDYYFNIYVLITMASVVLGIMRFLWLYYGSLRASRNLYEQLLHRVIRAPLRFFDTTPVGRILNRFSKDFETIDSILIGDLALFLNNVIMMISTVMVITAITKEFLIASSLFGILYIIVGSLYAKASRELKRIDSVTKSPLYSHFGETLLGITTIRAFGAKKKFMIDMLTKIDNNHRPFYLMWCVNRWLSIRFNVIGSFLSFLAGLFVLLNIDHIDAGLAGLSLSFAMTFSKQIMWSVRKYTALEMSLNAVERIDEFLHIPQEAPEIVNPRPPAAWPHSGNIQFENVEVKYAPDLEPVLHHISFNIQGQEKIGLVGRTGSGKSTISLTLFRFIEPSDGNIFIDNIDIGTIGVEDLRSRITIIPQDPILFTDAFSQYRDYEIYEALQRVHLLPSSSTKATSSISSSERNNDDDTSIIMTNDDDVNNDNISMFSNLDTPITEGGKNFSQGQRQLLCLARALLKRSKIILMDEATARLRTVIDYDRILVLDQGNVVEFDRPYNLITDSNSLFHKMCKNSGEFDTLLSLVSSNKK
nr:735_t:CDS:10 [Entrophospora candida]